MCIDSFGFMFESTDLFIGRHWCRHNYLSFFANGWICKHVDYSCSYVGLGGPRGIMAKVLDHSLKESELDLQLIYNVYLRTNAYRKGMYILILSSHGLNSIITVFL